MGGREEGRGKHQAGSATWKPQVARRICLRLVWIFGILCTLWWNDIWTSCVAVKLGMDLIVAKRKLGWVEAIAHSMDSNRNTTNSGPTRVEIYTSDVLFGMDYSLEQNATWNLDVTWFGIRPQTSIAKEDGKVEKLATRESGTTTKGHIIKSVHSRQMRLLIELKLRIESLPWIERRIQF